MAYNLPPLAVTGVIIPAAWGNAARDSIAATAVGLASAAGQIPYATGANALAMLAAGSANKLLGMNSAGTAPEWKSVTADGSGNLAGGTYNGQTLSASASFTGTGKFASGIGVGNAAPSANVLINATASTSGSVNQYLLLAGNWTPSSGATGEIGIANIGVTGPASTATGTFYGFRFSFSLGAASSLTNYTGFIVGAAPAATNATDFLIGTTSIPTGTFAFYSAGAAASRFGGALGWITDNASDIGASGANRPRTVYVGTEVVAGTSLTAAGNPAASTANTSILAHAGSSLARWISRGADTSTNGAFEFLSTRSDGSSSSTRWKIDTSGHLLTGTDNAYDIGASGANRPRKIYTSTGIDVGTGIITNVVSGTVSITPTTDNTSDAGTTGTRFRDVWCSRGAFNGSSRDLKHDFNPVARGTMLRLARRTIIGTYRYKPTDPGDTNAARVHVGFIAEDVDALLCWDHKNASPQTTGSVALAAVADEADARESDIAALKAEIARLETLIQKRKN